MHPIAKNWQSLAEYKRFILSLHEMLGGLSMLLNVLIFSESV